LTISPLSIEFIVTKNIYKGNIVELDDFGADVDIAEKIIPPLPPSTFKPMKEGGLMPLGLHDGMSNDDYHKGKGISSTSIKHAIRAMKLYRAYQTGEIKFHATPAMNLGTAVHKLTLEEEDFYSEIIISPEFGRSKADQVKKIEFEERTAKGKTIITKEQFEKCQFMRDAIMALPETQDIFSTGKAEQSGYYIDRKTGQLCKYRPDWRTDWALFDIKTTRDGGSHPDKFSRSINDLGYHISAAHYLAGDTATMKTDHNQFIFLCVESEPPYLAATYRLTERSIELGMLKRRQALDMIKHCREVNEWPTYNGGICQDIEVPAYAMYELDKANI
jgi:exodeoxyribonuclease VIII